MWEEDDFNSEDDAETRETQFNKDERRFLKLQKQKGSQRMKLEPGCGSLVRFYYQNHLIGLRREARPGTTILTEESELIWLYSFNKRILHSVLNDVRELRSSKDHWVKYFRGTIERDVPRWYLVAKKTPRSVSTLVLDGELLAGIESDIREYRRPMTENFYKQLGKPYRRGFLLHGPPGTGKSSLCAVLAGMFCMDLYTFSLNNPHLTEDALVKMFRDLPDHSMVVLEDIDRALCSIGQSKTDQLSDVGSQMKSSGISISALLNVIDGPGAKENRVLFMTTNHVDKLEPALIRPGQIDGTFYLGHATAPMIEQLFSLFYAPLRLGTNEISEMARKFANQISSKSFTAAEIQNFLLKYKGVPEEAVSNAAQWAKEA
ncbi:hypothetical protein N7540_013044 [Penicillium herquei]|nr:hypothetical protein N7540_013044 [Penicillium herquei]